MYRIEIFDQSMNFVSACYTDDAQTISLDYLAFDPFQITIQPIEAQKGYFCHITKENETVADCIISDVKPGKETQQISLRPLQALFDADVYYTPVSDAITWIAQMLNDLYVTTSDVAQRRPLNVSYTPGGRLFPLTGYNFGATINVLSVITTAFRTWGVVTEASLDLVNKEIIINIFEQTATKVIECDLENVISSEVTLGDSYGSTNKLIIKKTVAEGTPSGTTEITYYRHNDGTIDTTDSDRIVPVFWQVTTLEQTEDMTDAQWITETATMAQEALTPAKYDNEVVISVWEDDMIVRPKEIALGTITELHIKGTEYYSILTGEEIEGNVYTLTFGAVRTELTKKLSIQGRYSSSSVTYSGGGGGGGGESDISVLYFYNRTVSVASNAEILRITNASINANTVVLECTFADPSYISGTVTWTSTEGYISFIGTCTSATTANVTLSGISEGDLHYLTPEDAVLTQGMTAIPANADLNDYKAVGTYNVTSNATASTIVNRPIGIAFKMVVDKTLGGTNATQTLTTYQGDTYIRTYQSWSSSWTAWQRSVLASDFLCQTFRTSAVTINSNNSYHGYVSVTVPSGYKLFAITHSQPEGEVILTLVENGGSHFGAEGTTNVSVWAYNQMSYSTTISVAIVVLFIKK